MEKLIHITLVLLSFAFGFGISESSQASEQVCIIQKVPFPAVQQRTRSVVFPDGRVIVIVGNNHGDRSIHAQIKEVIEDFSLSNEEFSEAIIAQLDRATVAVRHSYEDLIFLKSMLEKNPKFKFIGYESTPEIAAKNHRWVLSLQETLEDVLDQRGISVDPTNLTPSIFESAVRLVGGAPLYIGVSNPKLFQDRYLLGIESETATELWDEAVIEKKAASQALRAVTKAEPGFTKNLISTEISLASLAPTYNHTEDAPGLIAQVEQTAPERFRAASLRWIHGILNELNARRMREEAQVSSAVTQKEWGILFLGREHLESTARLLREACLKESTLQAQN